MAFTTNLSGTTELNDSIVQEYDQQFILSYAEEGVASQFATYKKEISSKSIDFTRYDQLALATTALTETDDVTSEAMVDNKVTLTPEEIGNVVTTTKLANLQTGGKADLAAARLVGINAGRTKNKLAQLALDASTNVLYANDATATANIDAADIMGSSELNKAYNKLSRASVPGVADGMYVALMHDDVIHDIRDSASAGEWQNVLSYKSPEQVLRNEVGMFRGFIIIRDNQCLVSADAGSGTVDVYKSHFLGFNALGLAESMPVEMRATGPFDKLSRFLNIGHLGVYKHLIVQQDALWTYESASSVGANA